MSGRDPIPQSWIDGCVASQRRLDALIAGLTDEQARGPTLLEGWTVGHLLTHLARNADGHRGIFEAAQHGELISQYPGGPAQREGDIAAGAGRSATELVADVRETSRRLGEAWSATSREAWETGLGVRAKGPTSLPDFVWLRWREVEVHLIDLDLPGSPDWDDLDPAYVDLEWQMLVPGLKDRLPEGTLVVVVPEDRPSRAFGTGSDPVIVRASAPRILRWLFGRGSDEGWPDLKAWS